MCTVAPGGKAFWVAANILGSWVLVAGLAGTGNSGGQLPRPCAPWVRGGNASRYFPRVLRMLCVFGTIRFASPVGSQ